MLNLNNPNDVFLTEKEEIILRLTYNDESTKKIAFLLNHSPRTIESIRDDIKKKTGATGFAGLTVFAQRANLTDFPGTEELEKVKVRKKELV